MGLKIQTDQERIPPSSEPGRHLALCKEPDEGAPPDTSDVEDLVRYDWNDDGPAATNNVGYFVTDRYGGWQSTPRHTGAPR